MFSTIELRYADSIAEGLPVEYRDNIKRKPAMTVSEWDALVERNRLRGRTAYLVKRGVIQKTPCMACGSAEVQAHHVDYQNILDVVWLCRAHHEQIHHPNPGDKKAKRWADAKPQDAFL